MKPEIPHVAASCDDAQSQDSGRAPTDTSLDKKAGPDAEKKTIPKPFVFKRRPGKSLAAAASIALLISAAASTTFYYMNQQSKSTTAARKIADSPAQTVSVATATMAPIDDELTVTGSVSAWDPLNIGAEANNLRVKEITVEEGDFVKKGQVLAYLNSALLLGQLQEAMARLKSSQATLKKAITPNREEEVLALKAALAQSEADRTQQEALKKEATYKLKDAELNARRYIELHRVGVSSSMEAEAKQLAADTARDELASANAKLTAMSSVVDQNKQKLLQAQNGGRSEDVAISRAAIAQTEAQIQELTEQINQTIVRAPDDGLISKRMVHLGEIVATGTPLFSLIRMNKLELRAQVPDTDLLKFKVGQKVEISLKEDEASKFGGTVRLVSPLVDDASRIGIVRIALPANVGLKPGMFVRGQVHMGVRQGLTVPPQSLARRNGESFVFLLNGDRADSCAVKVGAESDRFVEIVSGLKLGQVVVADGARFLSDHDLVHVAK